MLKSLLKHLLRTSRTESRRTTRMFPNLTGGKASPSVAAQELLGRAVHCQNSGHLAEAERLYRTILRSDPKHIEALLLLGSVLKLQDKVTEAIDILTSLTALAPQHAAAQFTLADALLSQRRLHEASQAYRVALELQPDLFPALQNLADILTAQGKMDEAESHYTRALALKPESDETRFKYGNLLFSLGRLDEAVANYRQALQINPDLWCARSNLLFTINYSPDYTPEEVFREHLEWGRCHAAPLKPSIKSRRNARALEHKLRVGYVSADFRHHPVGYFFEPTLKHHDHDRLEVFCYSDVRTPDACTDRMRAYGGTWRDIVGQRDEAVAERIADDQIDILVDLSGHTAENRLMVFARKPAPIQVTWNGYPNTTGMAAMDYRITDAYADPPGMTEHLYTEQLVRLPEIYMAYQPPEKSPPVVPPPSLANGYVTFGSFNALAKVGRRVIAVWARILGVLPTARLVVLGAAEGQARARLLQAFAGHGIEPARIELIAKLPFEQFLEAHQQVDIALDPFPFNGAMTTCQTLWMGVPLITLAGRTHISRVGVSMLSNLGLQRLIARDEHEYASLAVALARDHEKLVEIRAGLRERMLASPNTDGARLTRFLEAEYARMWQEYCLQMNVH